MKIAYFDCIGGASGDMLLSTLADVGVPHEVLRGVVAALRLPGCDLHFERVMKGPLAATQVTVVTPQQEEHRHLSHLLDIVRQSDLPESVRAKTETALRRIAEVEAGIHNEPVEHVHLHEVGGDDTLIDIAGALVGLDWLGVGSGGGLSSPAGTRFHTIGAWAAALTRPGYIGIAYRCTGPVRGG